MLLKHGASTRTNLVGECILDHKPTLLTLAVSETYGSNLPYDVWGMVFLLLEHKQDIDYFCQGGETSTQSLDINEPDSFGQTALHSVQACENEALVVLLLDNNADVNVRDFAGDTPLNLLMKRCSGRTLPGRDFRNRKFASDRTRTIAKQDAIKEFVDDKVTIAALLLESGADPLIEDDQGCNSIASANKGCGGLMPVLVDPYQVEEQLLTVRALALYPVMDLSHERNVLEETLRKCVRHEPRPPRALFLYEHGDKFHRA